jgi:cell division protein FtsW
MKTINDKLQKIDTPLAFCYLCLVLIGLFIQLDITAANGHMDYFFNQFFFTLVSISACLLTYLFLRLNFLESWVVLAVIYIITIILLILVLIIGADVNGARRAIIIPLGFARINLQPSMLARLTLILLFAYMVKLRQNYIQHSSLFPFLKNFAPLILLSLPIFFLILKEHHFSAIIISGITMISLLFLANIKLATIIILIICLLAGGWIFLNHGGDDYIWKRIRIYIDNSLLVNFLRGHEIKNVTDYNTEQSLICLTSGKIFGTSPDKGMGKYYYLPESRTDYVFSIIGEEFGLVGSLFVIFIFMGLIIRGLNISARQSSNFRKLLGYGICLNIFYNFIINVSVAAAAIPPTGVTLPFISHGGSAMMINSISIGILLLLSRTSGETYEAYSNQ